MWLIRVLFSFGCLGLFSSLLQAQTWQEELNFKVNVLQLMEGDIHYSFEIHDRANLLKQHPEFTGFDSLSLLHNKKNKFIISKSAWVVNKPIGFFDHQHMTDENFIRHLLNEYQVQKTHQETFRVGQKGQRFSYRLRTFFDSDDISTLDRSRMIHTVAAAKKMDVMVQSATASVVQELDQFTEISPGAVILLSHIPLKENKTLIISYRLSALLPSHAPSKQLRDNLSQEYQKLQQRINSFGKKTKKN